MRHGPEVTDDERSARLQLPSRVLTWWSTEPLGSFKSLAVVTGGPAAILAAFTIGAVVSVLGGSHFESLDAAAVALFSASAALLLGVLVAAVAANEVGVAPDERLAWFPEASGDDEVLTTLRHRQLDDFTRYLYLRRRIMGTFRVGMSLALLGLAALMLARIDGSHFDLDVPEAPQEVLLAVAAGVAVFAAACALVGRSPVFTRDEDKQARRGAALGFVDPANIRELETNQDASPTSSEVANALADVARGLADLSDQLSRIAKTARSRRPVR
jgi:hypothetical protein